MLTCSLISSYNIFLLTTIQSTGAVTLHRQVCNRYLVPSILYIVDIFLTSFITLPEQNDFVFNDENMNYSIGAYNKNLFVAGNGQTVGTFPGFKLNNQYRVYINYFNAAGVQQNQAGGQVEMSLHASPMIQASPPLVLSHKVLVISLCIILNAFISTECQIMRDSRYLDLALQFSHRFAI